MYAEVPTVLVTGANRGLGREFVSQYSNDGWQVIATYRRRENFESLQKIGEHVFPVELDVTKSVQIDRLAKALNNHKIDLLINNAGVNRKERSIFDIEEKVWLEIMHTNALSPVKLTKSFLGSLILSESPKVVSITSDLGSIQNSGSGGPWVYKSSKAALNMAFKSISGELAAKQISCALIHPGWVRTDMGGEDGKLSTPQSVCGIRRVIEDLTLVNTGQFWNHEGNTVPW